MYKKLLNFAIPVTNTSNISTFLSRNVFMSCQQYATAYKHRTLEKRLGLPPKPKRPLSPFFQYIMNQRKVLATTDSSLSQVELIKKLSADWHTFDINEKDKMKETYRKQLDKYTKEVMAYEGSLTGDQKNMVLSERSRLAQLKEKRKMKSRLLELGRPKKPAAPFVLYMVSKLNTRNKDHPFPEWLTVVAKEWANLSDDNKATFKNESKKLMAQYEVDLVLWESKMIKMGYIDLIRRHVLLDLKGKNNVTTDATTN